MKATYFLTLVLVAFPAALFAQEPSQWQKEIDEQVWTQFDAAFERYDATALNALYAEEVLRVTPAGIDTESRFKLQNSESYAGHYGAGNKRDLQFWFESRHTNATTSYEVGMFKITTTTNGQASSFYGQFHIVIKKLNGTWKITQDWDTAEVNGKLLDADDFGRKPAQF